MRRNCSSSRAAKNDGVDDNAYNYWPNDEETSSTSSATITSPTTHINNDTISMWEAINFTPNEKNHFIIRAFIGGEKSIQRDAFSIEMARCIPVVSLKYGLLVNIEYMNTKTLCSKGWSPSQLIEWLLSSNMHFITAHAHQGLRSHGISWDMTVYMKQLQRLKFHVGFPCRDQLRCPIFTQDKYQYLQNLGELANNTMIINLTADGEYDPATIIEIERYSYSI